MLTVDGKIAEKSREQLEREIPDTPLEAAFSHIGVFLLYLAASFVIGQIFNPDWVDLFHSLLALILIFLWGIQSAYQALMWCIMDIRIKKHRRILKAASNEYFCSHIEIFGIDVIRHVGKTNEVKLYGSSGEIAVSPSAQRSLCEAADKEYSSCGGLMDIEYKDITGNLNKSYRRIINLECWIVFLGVLNLFALPVSV